MSIQSEIDRIEQNIANTYTALSDLGADMPTEQNSDNLAQTVGHVKAVLYIEQTLTEAQQDQARENVGAASQIALDQKVSLAPEYVSEEASLVVNKAISHDDSRVFRFIALSDAHQNNDDQNNSNGNRDAGYGVGEILTMIGVEFVTFLGDSVWGSATNTISDVINQAKQFNKYFASALKGENQIRIEGNHDDAYYSSDSDPNALELTPSDMYAFFYSYNKGVTPDPEHIMDGYCYRDYPGHKVRVVALNTNQGVSEGGVMNGYQLKWFAETALDMSGKTDWQLMILSHHPLDYGMPTLFKDAVNILDAWLQGGVLSYTTSNGVALSMDYADKNCQFIANFHGHTHSFAVVRMQKYVNGTYVDIDAWEINIPNASFSRNNQHVNNTNERFKRFSTPTTYNKTAGTAESTSFNVVTVAMDAKIIYADVYGAGIDRQVDYDFAEITWSVSTNLTNATISNGANQVKNGDPYSAVITANNGYEISTITVLMGGTNITSSVVSGNAISIQSVSGDLSISVTAQKISPSYTNQIPISTDASGGIYNGIGYKLDTRLNSSGADTGGAGYGTTGFIPIPAVTGWSEGQVVLWLANMEMPTSDANVRIALYNSDKAFTKLARVMDGVNAGDVGYTRYKVNYWLNSSGYVERIDLSAFIDMEMTNTGNGSNSYSYVRLCAPGLDGDSIITVNEPIES